VCVYVVCLRACVWCACVHECVRASHISCFEGADGFLDSLYECYVFGGHSSSVPSGLLQSRIKIQEMSEFMGRELLSLQGLEIMYGAINYKSFLKCLDGRMNKLISFLYFYHILTVPSPNYWLVSSGPLKIKTAKLSLTN
jgi:hypothetical protein